MDAPRKIIGGREFAFGQMPPKKAMRVLTALAPALTDAVGKLALFTGSKVTAEEQVSGIAKAISAGLARVPWDDYTTSDGRVVLGLESMATMMFAYVSCDGKPVDLDLTFNGRVAEIPAVFAEGLRVNYTDFLGAVRSLLLVDEEKSNPSKQPT